MRPQFAPDTIWEQTLAKAGYRIIHDPYRMGEANELVPPGTSTSVAPFASQIDLTLGLPLAPPRVKP